MWRLEWNRAFVGAALIAAVWASRAQAGTCNLPAWNFPVPGTPMGAAVYGHAAASNGTLIYSAGGAIAFPVGTNLDLFQSYNPVANAWANLPPVPIPVGGGSLHYSGGKLFLFGGIDNSSNPRDLLQIYTLATGAWSIGPSMPAPRFAMGGGVINGLIYLVGGSSTFNPNMPESQTWEFDPAAGPGTYTSRASLPAANYRSGSGVSGGRLYVISGADSNGTLVNTNYEYNPATNAWTTRAPITTAVNKPGGTTLGAMDGCNGDIIIVSGGTPFLAEGTSPAGAARTPHVTAITQIYDVGTDSWSNGPPLGTGRFSLQAAQAGNTLIAFGGYDGSAVVATVDRIQGPPLPVQLQGFRVE